MEFHWRPVAVVVAAKSALALAFADRYGWHRDELYLRAAGRRPALGYVDFPPVTPLLARFDSLVALRALAVLAGAGVVVVAALVARELGGAARAQTAAAILVAFSPMLLAANGLFQPVSFDQLWSLLLLWLATRIAPRPARWEWPLVGLVVGVGLETKYTLGVLTAVLLASFAVWRRDALRAPGLPAAVGIALLIVLPNLVWQAGHDWASVRFFLDPPPSASAETRPEFVLNLVLLTNVVAVPVALAGVLLLRRDRRLRPLAATVAGTVVAYFVLGGKSYYAMPVVLYALAAGGVWLARRRHVLVPALAYGALTLVLLPIGVPVVPAQAAQRHGIVDLRGGDYGVENEERGRPVARCTFRGGSLSAVWPLLVSD